jgi:Mrp family chromosome partitioning ATPase
VATEVLRQTGASGLYLLPAGAKPPNPAELLGSSRFADLLKTLGNQSS